MQKPTSFLGPAKKLPYHPVVELFPKLSDEEREKLKASINKNGVTSPVVVWNDVLIDGRHRYEICLELDMPFPVKFFDGTEVEAIEHAWSLNDNRRHLTYLQRATLAAKLATMKHGGNRKSDDFKGSQEPLISVEKAAAITGVSRETVKRKIKIDKKATPEVKAALESGDVSLKDAAAVASAPAKVQREAVAQVEAGTAKTLAEALAPKTTPVLEAAKRLRTLVETGDKDRVYGRVMGVEPKAYIEDLVTVAAAYLGKNRDRGLAFVPPTIEEVRAHCQEKGYDQVDAESFVAFYQSKGWKVGTAPMKDWKGACVTWQRNRRGGGKGPPTSRLEQMRRELRGS